MAHRAWQGCAEAMCEGAAVLPVAWLTIGTGDLDTGDLQGNDTGVKRRGVSGAERTHERICGAQADACVCSVYGRVLGR